MCDFFFINKDHSGQYTKRRAAFAASERASAGRHNHVEYGRSSAGRSEALPGGRHGCGRVELHGRDGAVAEADRAGAGRGRLAESSQAQECGLHGHTCEERPRQGHRHMHGRELRVRRDIQDDAARGGAQDAAAEEHGPAGQAALVLLVRHHRLHHAHRLPAGSPHARDVHHRRELGRGGHTRRLADRGDGDAGAGRDSHGAQEGHRQEAADCGDARLRQRHMLGQDGHADRQRDDRARAHHLGRHARRGDRQGLRRRRHREPRRRSGALQLAPVHLQGDRGRRRVQQLALVRSEGDRPADRGRPPHARHEGQLQRAARRLCAPRRVALQLRHQVDGCQVLAAQQSGKK